MGLRQHVSICYHSLPVGNKEASKSEITGNVSSSCFRALLVVRAHRQARTCGVRQRQGTAGSQPKNASSSYNCGQRRGADPSIIDRAKEVSLYVARIDVTSGAIADASLPSAYFLQHAFGIPKFAFSRQKQVGMTTNMVR